MPRFTVRYRRGALIHGQRGYEYEIYESGGPVPVHVGWTAGKRSDAYAEAHAKIREIEARRASAEEA